MYLKQNNLEKVGNKMEKVVCNGKENEVVKEESEKSCGLIFSFSDSGEPASPHPFQERWYKLQKQPPRFL